VLMPVIFCKSSQILDIFRVYLEDGVEHNEVLFLAAIILHISL
jgi:hypothetical protein